MASFSVDFVIKTYIIKILKYFNFYYLHIIAECILLK